MTPEQESAGINYMLGLARAELDGVAVPATLEIGPYSAFILLGCMQTTVRHPSISQDQRDFIRKIGDQFAAVFAGTPAEPVIAAGWDPGQDPGPGPDMDLEVSAGVPGACPECEGTRWHADLNSPGGLIYQCQRCGHLMTSRQFAQHVADHLMETVPGQDDLAPAGGQDDLAPEGAGDGRAGN